MRSIRISVEAANKKSRLFPYSVTVGALGVFFLIVILVLRNNNKLIPNFILIGSFILFVLNLTGLIETAIELFGTGGANSMCSASNLAADGATLQTLAYLAQSTICERIRQSLRATS